MLPQEHSLLGKKKGKLKLSELVEDTGDISSLVSQTTKNLSNKKEISVTVGSQPVPKKKIWKDKNNTLELDSQITKLSEILDQGSILKEKVSTPFWTPLVKGDISEIVVTHRDRLCRFGFELIERIVSKFNGKIVVLDKEKHPLKKNSLTTSFQLSQFSLPDSMDSVPIPLKTKLKKQPKMETPLKTMKFRLFPNETQKLELQKC